MSKQGWTELYLSSEVANPTTGAGAVLFNETAPVDLFMLRFTVFNDATVPLEYLVEVDTGSGWEERARWSVDAKNSGRFSDHFPVYAGEQIRLAVVSNPDATGVSLAAVEYLKSQ
jgi:hypothetical protein